MERVEPASLDQGAQPAPQPTFKDPIPSAPPRVPAPEPGLTADNPLELNSRMLEPARRVSRPYFWAASVFSAFWIAGFMANLTGYAAKANLTAQPVSWWVMIVAAILIPPALAFIIASVVREARMLRRQAAAMAAAASNLSQPSDRAAQGVTRLSKAVRDELDRFNAAMDAAYSKLNTLESANSERLAAAERFAAQAQNRVEAAAQRLGVERERLQAFANSLEQAVSGVGEALNARVAEARAAARAVSEGLGAEQTAIATMMDSLNAASAAAGVRASEMAKEIDRQAQKLDAASEAAAARSEQVIQRHERHRNALQETLERLKAENDQMTGALEAQREAFGRLVSAVHEEAKHADAMAAEGVKRIDAAASGMSERIVETAKALAAEIDRLKTQSELSSSGISQAVETIKSAGQSSYDAAGRLGAQLTSLSESAARASLEVDAGITRLQRFMADLPRDALTHAEQLRGLVEGQSVKINDLSGRIASAFEKLQTIEGPAKAAAPLSPRQAAAAQQPAASAEAAPKVPPPEPQSAASPPPATQAASQPPASQPPASQPPASQPQASQPRATVTQLRPGAPAAPLAPLPQGPAVQTPGFQAPPLQGPGFQGASQTPKTPERTPERTPDRPPERPADRPAAFVPPNPAPMPETPAARGDGGAQAEIKGWLGMAKRLVRLGGQDESANDPPPGPRGTWDMKQLLQAAEQPQRLDPIYSAANKKVIEALQQLAVDIDRYLEDDPPLDLMRRSATDPDVFARRLVQVMSRHSSERLSRRYQNDHEFHDVVDRYCAGFENLMSAAEPQGTARIDELLATPVGKAYVALAKISQRI